MSENKEKICSHIFCCVDKNNKPICEKCGFEAELYYEKKFNDNIEFTGFLVGRLFDTLQEL